MGLEGYGRGFVAYLKVLSRLSPGETGKTNEEPVKKAGSNRIPPEYKSRELPLFRPVRLIALIVPN
jgi:hypothetical protein